MSEHIPGPWRLDGMYIRRCDGQYIADVKLDDEDQEAIANARLIAAAPELLGALEQAYEALRSGNPDARVNALRDIPHVLAEAKGSAE